LLKTRKKFPLSW